MSSEATSGAAAAVGSSAADRTVTGAGLRRPSRTCGTRGVS